MDLFDSPLKIVRDPSGTQVTIVALGDPLAELPRIDGRQLVEALQHIRAAGPGCVSRGNESHTISLTVVDVLADLDASIEAAFDHAATYPRAAHAYQIETASGKKWSLAAAVAESWSAAILDGGLATRSITITGGALTVVA